MMRAGIPKTPHKNTPQSEGMDFTSLKLKRGKGRKSLKRRVFFSSCEDPVVFIMAKKKAGGCLDFVQCLSVSLVDP